jgi:cell division protease FtsH
MANDDVIANRPPMERPSRPKESERTTRKPLPWWDRVKLLLLFATVWVGLVLGAYFRLIGAMSRYDALYYAVRMYPALLVLFGLELIRQIHYLIAEHWKRYYAFWNRIWGRGDRARERIDPWTRFRIGRVLWVLFFLFVIGSYISHTYVFGPEQRSVSVIEGVLRAPALIMHALPGILQVVFIISIGVLQFVAIFWFMSKGGVQTYMPDDIETRFTDVKGQDAVLNRVQENMVFLENPESIESRGGYVPGGILLWGPPGTGKTLMAQAVAGESAKPFVFVEPGAFMAMFFGVGILKVKGLYRKLRKLATRYGGVIVFFDEADSLGNRGGVAQGGWNMDPTPGSAWSTAPSCNGLGYVSEPGRRNVLFGAVPEASGPRTERMIMPGYGGGGMGTLQALLSEMDGLKKPRGFVNRVIRRALGMKPKPPPKYRILHIFATNQPGVLDEAMLRPGRIDRIYKVGYPHLDGRTATFVYYLAKVKHELTDEQIIKLATITPYASGALIKDTVNEALVIAIRDGRERITWRDIVMAKQLKEHGLPDDHEYIKRERHAVAVHEACHAVVAYRLRKHAVIDVATIERRGDVGGFVSSIPPEDQFVEWRSERDIDIMTFLASLAGERLFFDGDHSTGVGGDMRGATTIATQMLAYYAMGDTIAARSVTLGGMRGGQPMETGSDRALFDTEFGKQVDAKLGLLYDETYRLLADNRAEVLAVGHALETHKTITGDDVAAIVDGVTGSLVDGRSYLDPVFRHELERYHDAAAKAHREHSGVDTSMPMPMPPPPRAALPPEPNGHGAEPIPAGTSDRQPIAPRPDGDTPATPR